MKIKPHCLRIKLSFFKTKSMTTNRVFAVLTCDSVALKRQLTRNLELAIMEICNESIGSVLLYCLATMNGHSGLIVKRTPSPGRDP